MAHRREPSFFRSLGSGGTTPRGPPRPPRPSSRGETTGAERAGTSVSLERQGSTRGVRVCVGVPQESPSAPHPTVAPTVPLKPPPLPSYDSPTIPLPRGPRVVVERRSTPRDRGDTRHNRKHIGDQRGDPDPRPNPPRGLSGSEGSRRTLDRIRSLGTGVLGSGTFWDNLFGVSESLPQDPSYTDFHDTLTR